MGCSESKKVSKQPGTSVVTDDTYLDECVDNVSGDHFVNSGNKKQENGRVINNNNDDMANRHSGNVKHTTTTANGYANKQTIGANNQRTQHITVISSNKPGYGKRNIKPSSNTQNITNLVDIEEYGDSNGHEVNSTEKPVTSTIVFNDTNNHNNSKLESKTSVKESIHSPKTIVKESIHSPKYNSDIFPKVIAPVNGIKRSTKPTTTSTNNITGVEDLEDYDYSDNQTISSVTKSSDDGRALNNNITKEYNKTNAKIQNNSITVISSNKPIYGTQKTKKNASSTTDSITNIVDLEEYD